MMLTVASFYVPAEADRLVTFLRKEYGSSLTAEVRLSLPSGRDLWYVYIDDKHPDWDTIRVLSYGFMMGAER